MALDIPPLVSVPPVNLGRNPDLRTYPVRQVNRAGSDFSPEEKEASNPRYSGEAPEASVEANLLAPSQWGSTSGGGSPRGPGALADSKSWDQSRPIYNPRGAPADAVPALSRLEARISFEPLYMHNYASTRYACVSFLPWTPAERRARVDLMV